MSPSCLSCSSCYPTTDGVSYWCQRVGRELPIRTTVVTCDHYRPRPVRNQPAEIDGRFV